MAARVNSDLRSYQNAAKTYFNDNGQYPSSASALTSPISYMSFLPKDPFLDTNTYRIFSDGSRFIAYSAGPDKTYQIDPEQDISKGEHALKAKTYDATNGSISLGDIYRSEINNQSSKPDYPHASNNAR